jgi:hypothetical protein
MFFTLIFFSSTPHCRAASKLVPLYKNLRGYFKNLWDIIE